MTSSPLPPSATSATIAVTPSSPEDNAIFNELTETLSTTTTTKARVLTCVSIYLSLKVIYPEQQGYEQGDPSLQALFLAACLELAFKLSQPPQHGTLRASEASARCPQRKLGVGVTVGGSAGHYVVHVAGTTHKAARRSALVVVWARVGSGLQITLRPRARGRTLRQLVGRRSESGSSIRRPRARSMSTPRSAFGSGASELGSTTIIAASPWLRWITENGVE